LRRILFIGRDKSILTLRSSTELHSSTTVAPGSTILLNELNLLEVMGADNQSAISRAATYTGCQSPPRRFGLFVIRILTNEVMAGVSDNQTDVVLSSEIDTGLDVFLGMCVDHVDAVVAEGAGTGRVVGRKALT
jgi:hypothetical protein